MSLIDRARADIARVTQDTNGFASEVTLTNPQGQSAQVRAFTNEVWQGLDPNSGNNVNGAVASIAISFDALEKAGLGTPQNPHNQSAKPWTVALRFADGVARTYKIAESRRDMLLGLIWYVIHHYKQ